MKLLIISGGMYHPYVVTTPIIEDFLKAAGHEVRVTEDASVLREPANIVDLMRAAKATMRWSSIRNGITAYVSTTDLLPGPKTNKLG